MKNEDYLRGFLEAVNAAEEPIHHLQSVLFYLQFKEAIPENKDVVISGHGGDMVFGSPFQNYNYIADKMSEKSFFHFLSKRQVLRFLDRLSRRVKKGRKYISALHHLSKRDLPLSDPNNILWSIGAYGSEDWVCHYFNITRQDIISNAYNLVKLFEKRSPSDLISIFVILGCASITQSIESKLGKSCGKIVYHPYLNEAMIDATFSIPWSMKVKRHKLLLCNVARQLEVPNFILNRPKSGFSIQPKRWATKNGIFEPLVPLASSVFDLDQIEKMQSIQPKKAMTFWNILNYSIWKRLCIHREPLDKLKEELNKTIAK